MASRVGAWSSTIRMRGRLLSVGETIGLTEGENIDSPPVRRGRTIRPLGTQTSDTAQAVPARAVKIGATIYLSHLHKTFQRNDDLFLPPVSVAVEQLVRTEVAFVI